jgi:sporulation protein YlmC with PRC-barrel domain
MLRKTLCSTVFIIGTALAGTLPLHAATPTDANAAVQYLPSVDNTSRASKLIGQAVYDSDASNATKIGTISDLLVGNDGAIRAAVIGVGGFLGIGEKNVAVDFKSIKWTRRDNGSVYAVLPTTKDALNAAPDYRYQTTAATGDTTNGVNGNAAPAMATNDAAKLQTVAPETISANTLINTTVYGPDNTTVGKVGDVILTKDGKIDAVVIDVGGFLGIGRKPVAIAYHDLSFRRDGNTLYVYTNFTKAQFNSAPQFVKNDYPAQRNNMLLHSSM